MKVSAVTPSAAASDPKHPDHDRWVKETTLKMEVEHAKRVGKSTRQAETENAYWLQRAERLAETQRSPKPVVPRKSREQRFADRGVTRTFAKPEKQLTRYQLSPCGRCGTCRRCKREKRVFAMIQKAKAGDVKFAAVLWRLSDDAMHAKNCTGKFMGWTKRDANRALIRTLEDVCDATTAQMGPWR